MKDGSTREQILHLLAEAAELEHNILCGYLYAAFSLKQREDEDLTPAELAAVVRWRGTLMELCIEEMVHLAQVSNLMVAIGSRPHFNRPNLPVAPGYHPAGIAIGLAPFCDETLEHFIFLERPEEVPVPDSDAFDNTGAPRPEPAFAALMPRAPHYETIGEFYAALRRQLALAARTMGEARLFKGSAALQLTGEEIRSADLVVVRGLEDAKRAIDCIVEQGEGSGRRRDDSHFGRFEAIQAELLAMRAARSAFEPARPVARDPVMHAPVTEGRTWIDGARSAPVIDAANAAYAAMLRCLAQLYEVPASRQDQRKAVLGAAMAAMKAVTALGCALTELPARDDAATVRAGMSFAVLRSTEGPIGECAPALLAERLEEIAEGVARLDLPGPVRDSVRSGLASAAAALRDLREKPQAQHQPRSG